MTRYYFLSNDEEFNQAFKHAFISLEDDPIFRNYALTLKEYLKIEYNCPFKEFLKKVSCEDIYEAYLADFDAKKFVDSIFIDEYLAQSAYLD